MIETEYKKYCSPSVIRKETRVERKCQRSNFCLGVDEGKVLGMSCKNDLFGLDTEERLV